MPAPAQNNPLTVWPLGKITIATGGTPVSILVNVGSQEQGKSDAGVSVVMPQGRAYSSKCTQLMFSAPTTNSGDVFIMYGNWPSTDTNACLITVAKGTTVSIPAGSELQSGEIDPKQYYVDGTTSDVVRVTAIGGN